MSKRVANNLNYVLVTEKEAKYHEPNNCCGSYHCFVWNNKFMAYSYSVFLIVQYCKILFEMRLSKNRNIRIWFSNFQNYWWVLFVVKQVLKLITEFELCYPNYYLFFVKFLIYVKTFNKSIQCFCTFILRQALNDLNDDIRRKGYVRCT